MTTLDICAPADQTEGTRSQVLRWLKAVGDTVTQHEPLIELETDKVTVEVPAPASGVLCEIVKAEQEEIAPGEVLGRLEATSVSLPATADTEATAAQTAPVRAEASRASLDEAATGAGGRATLGAGLSRAVRRLLAERGLDPSAIKGTGEGGRITVDDVAAYDAAKQADLKVPSDFSADPLVPAVNNQRDGLVAHANAPSAEPVVPDSTPATRSHSVPHTAVRKRIADHMVQSLLHTAPHVTTVFEADLTAVIAHRSEHRQRFQQSGVPLTFTAYFLKATVDAIRAVPEANSRWTDAALEIHDDVHVGVATAVDGLGLVVPVVRNVQLLDLFGIAGRLDQLITAAREGRLQPSDVRGGTFTISNHGVSGSLLAAPIVINQPQSAILGVGKVEKRPVVVECDGEERVVARPKCYVTLTIDHRVMDGHQANRFLQTFVRTLEEWPTNA